MAWLHYRRVDRRHPIGRPYAAVKVELVGRDRLEVLPEGLVVADADVLVAELPDKVVLVGPDGSPLQPSKKFWISTETIDPFHLVFDME